MLSSAFASVRACKPGEYHYEKNDVLQGCRAYGCLHLVPKEERVRSGKNQREAGGELRRSSDDGGHLIGAQFGGSCEPENLFPQNFQLNRKGYRSLEYEWKTLLRNGNQVYVDIYATANGKELRQDTLFGSYMVIRPDGSSYTETFSFANEDVITQQKWEDIVIQQDLETTPGWNLAEENAEKGVSRCRKRTN